MHRFYNGLTRIVKENKKAIKVYAKSKDSNRQEDFKRLRQIIAACFLSFNYHVGRVGSWGDKIEVTIMK
jgi:hypothetical protein